MSYNNTLKQASQAIQYTFTENLTVYEKVDEVQPRGDTKRVLKSTKKAPCRLSINNRDNLYQDPHGRLKTTYTLFTLPSTIRAGDMVQVNGTKFIAKDPMDYVTHQEVQVYKDAWN